jgi:hypothetical protein
MQGIYKEVSSTSIVAQGELQDSGGARAEADCVASGLEPKLTVLQAT